MTKIVYEIICGDELAALSGRLDLTVVHTVTRPDAGWEGRVGRIDQSLLDSVLPGNRAGLQYFICGPDAMMDAAEAALAAVGVPVENVHSERFAMV